MNRIYDGKTRNCNILKIQNWTWIDCMNYSLNIIHKKLEFLIPHWASRRKSNIFNIISILHSLIPTPMFVTPASRIDLTKKALSVKNIKNVKDYSRLKIVYFLLAGHKVEFIAPCGANKSTFWPASRKKNRVQHGKSIYFTRVVVTLALLGHQTSHSQNKFFFP